MWLVKDNQKRLREEVELLFEKEYVCAGWAALPVDFMSARTIERGHGRIEERVPVSFDTVYGLWYTLESLCMNL